LWLKNLGLRPVILEKQDRLGGLQNDSPYPNVWILGKNYPNGKAFAREVGKQIKIEKITVSLESEISSVKYLEREKIFQVEMRKKGSPSKATASFLVLATGVVPITGPFKSSSTVLIGPGNSIEQTDYKGKTVAILGGGDNAFENYQFIKKKKPKSVTIFARHVRAQIPFIQKIGKGDLKVGEYSVNSGNQTVNGKKFDCLVVMYGWKGVNALEPWFSLNIENHFVVTDSLRRTSMERVYAIGEVTQVSHPCCVTAMADGIIAAKDIQKRIDESRIPLEVKKKIK
jgi:thioredoxin reductase